MSSTAEVLPENYIATLQTVDSTAKTVESVQSAQTQNPIIVDFDETLFLHNSTEEYLNSLYPRTAGAIFLLGIKAIKPWRWLPQRLRAEGLSRDWCLVVAATLFFPWTLLVWRQRAKALAMRYWNWPLVEAIQANEQARVVVATLGFGPIVRPLLKHLPLTLAAPSAPSNAHSPTAPQSADRPYSLVACRFWQGAADRAKGKLAMVTEVLGKDAVQRSVVVTDSLTDAPLLAEVETPCLVQWPGAEFIPAMADVYLPLFYSERVKNPGKSHLLKQVVMGHWAFVAIAISFLSPHPLLNAAGLMLLTLSYWCVYEIGYQENDLMGEKYESQPILSETYQRYKSRVNLNTPMPWYWAMALALPGILLLEMSKQSLGLASLELSPLELGSLGLGTALKMTRQAWQTLILDVVIWLGVLGAARVTFWGYNQFNEEARIWIYPFLQTQKLFGLTLLVATNMVGAMLLLALTGSRWLHYCIYRCGGDRWRFSINLSCLVLFVMLLGGMSFSSNNIADLPVWQTATALGYCTIRALKGGKTVGDRIGLVTRSSSPAN